MISTDDAVSLLYNLNRVLELMVKEAHVAAAVALKGAIEDLRHSMD